MNSVGRVSDGFIPVLVIVNLSVGGAACVFESMRYMGIPLNWGLCVVSMLLIAGVYLLNRISDIEEDSANDQSRSIFILNGKPLLMISCSFLIISLSYFFIIESLNSYHMLIVLIGIAYSFKVIPLITVSKKIIRVRLKEIPLMKNIVVALLWSFSIFFLPAFSITRNPEFSLTIWLLIISRILGSISSTLF